MQRLHWFLEYLHYYDFFVVVFICYASLLSAHHLRICLPTCSPKTLFKHKMNSISKEQWFLQFWIIASQLVKISTVHPVLAVTSIKQPTCLKQPNKMFPNVKFVLIITSVKRPPALSSHFLCFPSVAA